MGDNNTMINEREISKTWQLTWLRSYTLTQDKKLRTK